MTKVSENLRQRRNNIKAERAAAVLGNLNGCSSVSMDILQSWQRCEKVMASSLNPVMKEGLPCVQALWEASLLRVAMRQEKSGIIDLADESQVAVAISDASGRLLWSYSSLDMQQQSEELNFQKGACWGELDSGSNAIGLAIELNRAVSVFSLEHYLFCMQDCVSYAAPLIFPQTGECLGVLGMLACWDKYTPLGLLAVKQVASSIEKNLAITDNFEGLEVHMLGQSRVRLNGELVRFSPRQLEILCLLVLNPDGVTLGELHAKLYGDAKVSLGALKADISNLRILLGGQIGSRPYRLTLPVYADFIDVFVSLAEKRSHDAIALYRGVLLPLSESPEIIEWNHCIEVAVSDAIDSCGASVELLAKKLSNGHSGTEVIRNCLLEGASK